MSTMARATHRPAALVPREDAAPDMTQEMQAQAARFMAPVGTTVVVSQATATPGGSGSATTATVATTQAATASPAAVVTQVTQGNVVTTAAVQQQVS